MSRRFKESSKAWKNAHKHSNLTIISTYFATLIKGLHSFIIFEILHKRVNLSSVNGVIKFVSGRALRLIKAVNPGWN